MKKIVVFLFPLIMLYNAHAANNELIGKFTESFPNIIMGEVYYVTQTSFFMTVDLEFKGNLEAQVFEVVFDGTKVRSQDVKVGEKVLAFVNRLLVKPMDIPPFTAVKTARFDRFSGQCAYRFMNSELDNDFLSQMTSVLYQKELATVYTY